MVNVVSAVSAAQNNSLKPSVQSASVATVAPQAQTSDANIDFVTSGIYVNNLQNVAILEYRSSQTGQILQQYPNQAQINAFKAAQRLAEEASQKPAAAESADVHQTAAPSSADTTATETAAHVSAPATGGAGTSSSSSGDSSGAAGSAGGKTTSVVA